MSTLLAHIECDGYSNQLAHQRKKRNAYLNKRRRLKREKKSSNSFTTTAPLSNHQLTQRKTKCIDLFPAVTEDLRKRISERKRLLEEYARDPENNEKPSNATLYARSPTDEENQSVLRTVEASFLTIESGYHKIYDERTSEIIAMVEFIQFTDLSSAQFTDLNFLCLFLHQCKEFISPVASKSRKCGGIMWALGWQKGYEGLEILGRYRNQEAIDKNTSGFTNLMQKSSQAGKILWDIFYGFGDVAVKKNQEYMNRFNIPSFANNNFPKIPGDKSPFGFASNLAFSSEGFYNHHHKDGGDASELPLAFALIIPTSKLTGKMATKEEGYDVKNGQFIFRYIQVALNFKPDTICRMIFRAQEYVHGTLYPTEPTDFTKLGMSLQVATKASNVCKKYLEGEYNDKPDKYFCGVDELLGN